MTKLSSAQIQAKLPEVDGFRYETESLSKEYKFPSFIHAFGWMSSVALVAQAMDHHPEWSNVYSQVSVKLSTHDAGGVTEKDFRLARQMNDLYRD